MKIALASLDQIWENKEANLRLCTKEVIRASNLKCELIIFPELTLTGFSMNPEKLAEDLIDSHTLDQFQSLARENSIAIQFGLILNENNHYYNASISVDFHGNLISLYKKMHPFSFAKENEKFSSGKELVKYNINGIKIGTTICYDLRFPELFSALAKECQVIVNIANWPTIRIDHWRTLIMARAIENQLFLVGVNRTGKDANQLIYEESSMIAGPDGQLVTPLLSDGNFQVFDLNLLDLAKYRSKFPTYQDRRAELYRKFI